MKSMGAEMASSSSARRATLHPPKNVSQVRHEFFNEIASQLTRDDSLYRICDTENATRRPVPAGQVLLWAGCLSPLCR